jgi:molybdate transport system ATP-binding protein
MSIAVDIDHVQGPFSLVARFEAGAGVLALFGESGSGKTTLLNIVAGLIKPNRGRIAVDGEVLTDTAMGVHLPAHRRRIGYVFQDARLFPHLSVRQNLNYGRWRGQTASHGKFEEIVALLALGPLLDGAPEHLSGGEKQRVAIGRALLAEPRLLLMDEPLAALDRRRKNEILPFLETIRDAGIVPMIYVSHAIPEVVRIASAVVVLGSGRIVASGSVADVFAQSDWLPEGDRKEAGAVLDAVVVGGTAPAGLTLLQSPGNTWQVTGLNAKTGLRLRLRIRARDVLIALNDLKDISALNCIRGTILDVKPAGAGTTDVLLDCSGDRLVAQLTTVSAERLQLRVGLGVHAIVKAVAFDGA